MTDADAVYDNWRNPAVSLLAGWLAGVLDGRGRKDFDIRSVEASPAGLVTVTFGTGLVLLVKVEEEAP